MASRILAIGLFFVLISSFATALPDPGVTPDSPFLWRAELIGESITGFFNPALREQHREERLAEYEAMIQAKNAVAAQKAADQELGTQVRSQERQRLDQEFKEQFVLGKDVLEAIRQNVNTQLSSSLAQRLDLADKTVGVFVKSPDAEDDYFLATLEDGQVTELVPTDVLTAGDADVLIDLSYGEFFSLSQRDANGFAGLAKRLRYNEQKRQGGR